jgi:hypothetical protein
MPLFREFSEDEIEAIQQGKHHPKWVFYETPKWYVAFIWAVTFIPMFLVLPTENWFTIRIFVAGFGLQLYHSLYYHKSLEKNIVTTGFYMKRIPEQWAYVKPFYARDMLKWIYSMYGQGFHKLMRFAFKIAGILSGIGLVIALIILIAPAREINIPIFDFLLIIPPRWRYFFEAFNLFSADGAALDQVLTRGFILYNFKNALMTNILAWYVLLLFIPVLVFYMIQMLFFGIRIYMLGSFLHHFGYWHHERKPTDKKHPISNLLALLIISMFLFATLFMRLWAPMASFLIFMTISPQSSRYNYFKQMSKTGRFISILGFIILAGSMLWAFLPVPMPQQDRNFELWLNAFLIPIIIGYLLLFLKGTKKDPNIEFEGVEKVNRMAMRFHQITKIVQICSIGLFLLVLINAILNPSWQIIFYILGIGICIFIFYFGWLQWTRIVTQSIPLVRSILPYLDDDKAHETDNHFWEGFASGFFIINTLIMASLVFRRYSVYTVGFAYLPLSSLSISRILIEFTITVSIFLAYIIVWMYFWTGTKGIHSVWHGLTVLVQKIEISGSNPRIQLPPIEKFLKIGHIYAKTMKIVTILMGIYFILAGLYLRSLVAFVLFGIVGTLFAKMYFHDINEDYPLIWKINGTNQN